MAVTLKNNPVNRLQQEFQIYIRINSKVDTHKVSNNRNDRKPSEMKCREESTVQYKAAYTVWEVWISSVLSKVV